MGKVMKSKDYKNLSIDQINKGVVEFLKYNNMAGSVGGYDYYQLMQVYTKSKPARKAINKIVKQHIGKVDKTLS